MTVRRVLIGILLALGAAATPLALPGGAAHAQDPVELGSGHVVDQARVLSEADIDSIESATASLRRDHGIQLYVVYVDHFTNPSGAEDWANDTAARNDLGPTDYLLVVSTDGSSYYLSGDDSGPIGDAQLRAIEQTRIDPKLRTRDWAASALGATQGLADAAGAGGATAFAWVALSAGVIVVAVVAVTVVVRRRRRIGESSVSERKTAP